MKNNTENIIHQKSCSSGIITLRDDKILTFHPHENITTCNIDDLKEMYSIFMEFTNGVPHLYFSDNTNVKSFGPEERVFVGSNFHHFALACAIKEDSALVRFITHSILYLNKPQIPLKMSKTNKDNISWLKSLN